MLPCLPHWISFNAKGPKHWNCLGEFFRDGFTPNLVWVRLLFGNITQWREVFIQGSRNWKENRALPQAQSHETTWFTYNISYICMLIFKWIVLWWIEKHETLWPKYHLQVHNPKCWCFMARFAGNHSISPARFEVTSQKCREGKSSYAFSRK